MKTHVIILLIIVSLVLSISAQPHQNDLCEEANVRFVPLHIYLDSGNESLAAYQFELRTVRGQVKIVGIEGGEDPAFEAPPYYDPAALANDRVIIAAFNTGSDLPTGRTRITTIHLQIIGDAQADFELDLTVAANTNGKDIPANITFEKGAQK